MKKNIFIVIFIMLLLIISYFLLKSENKNSDIDLSIPPLTPWNSPVGAVDNEF